MKLIFPNFPHAHVHETVEIVNTLPGKQLTAEVNQSTPFKPSGHSIGLMLRSPVPRVLDHYGELNSIAGKEEAALHLLENREDPEVQKLCNIQTTALVGDGGSYEEAARIVDDAFFVGLHDYYTLSLQLLFMQWNEPIDYKASAKHIRSLGKNRLDIENNLYSAVQDLCFDDAKLWVHAKTRLMNMLLPMQKGLIEDDYIIRNEYESIPDIYTGPDAAETYKAYLDNHE